MCGCMWTMCVHISVYECVCVSVCVCNMRPCVCTPTVVYGLYGFGGGYNCPG